MEWILLPFMTPYLALVVYDASLHPRRSPSRIESASHAVAGIFVVAFLVTSVTGHDIAAAICLFAAVPAMLFDEICFHRDIGRHERYVHVAAFLSLAIYSGAWLWTR